MARINLNELHEGLKSHLDDFAVSYFPEAQKDSKGYRIGSVAGEKGKSLWFGSEGFRDHATGEKGSLIKLISLSRGIGIIEAAKELANKIGIQCSEDKELSETKPSRVILDHITEPWKKWLEGRALDYDLALAAGVHSVDSGDLAILHRDTNGRTVSIKYRTPNGAWNHPGGNHVLWPLEYTSRAFEDAETIYITEGHWDALAAIQCGFPAVSIPQGASNTDWIANCWNFIKSFTTIVLCYDGDEPGMMGLRNVVQRLTEGVRIIKYPEGCKDINDILRNCGVDEVRRVLTNHEDFVPENMVLASSLIEAALEDVNYEFEHETAFGQNFPFRYRPNESTVYCAYTGHGKALDLNTLVHTPKGLKPILEIQEGDLVTTPFGDSSRVIATSEIFTDHDCFEIEFDNGARVVADAGHLWLTDCPQSRASKQRSSKRGKPTSKKASNQDHKKVQSKIRTTAELYADQRGVYDGRVKYSIDLANPFMGFTDPTIKIPGYTLGAWLGDGTSSGGSMTCHIDDKQIIEEIEKDGYKTTKRSGKYSWGIYGLLKNLREAGVLNHKHIPEAAQRADIKYRLALLQGLMDTDGSITNGQCEFCTTKIELAEGVLRLASGLGIKARMYEGEATLDGKFVSMKYRIMFTTRVPVFRLKRKAEKIPTKTNIATERVFIKSIRSTYKRPVKCIQIEDAHGLFLITEQGIVTHNSSTIRQMALHFSAKYDEKTFIASFEDTPESLTRSLIQHLGPRVPRDIVEKLLSNILIYDTTQIDKVKKAHKVKPETIIALFEHQFKRYGYRHFVVDNLMTLDVDRQDNNSQSNAADMFRQFVLSYPVHLHLVAHPRKPPSKTKLEPPDPSEIRGASEIADMSWNIFSQIRNIEKGRIMDGMVIQGQTPDRVQQYDRTEPDAIIHIKKQRTTGDLPTLHLWFDKATRTFRTKY